MEMEQPCGALSFVESVKSIISEIKGVLGSNLTERQREKILKNLALFVKCVNNKTLRNIAKQSEIQQILKIPSFKYITIFILVDNLKDDLVIFLTSP